MWEQKSQDGVTSTEKTPAKQDEEVGARAGEGLPGVGNGNTGTAESLGALCQGEVAAEDTGCPWGLCFVPRASPREGSTAPRHGVPCSHSWTRVPRIFRFTERGRPRAKSRYVKNHAGGQKWQEPPRAGVGLAYIWVSLSGPTLRWQLVLGRPCGRCVETEYLGNERKQTPQGLRLSGGGEFSGSEVQGQRN